MESLRWDPLGNLTVSRHQIGAMFVDNEELGFWQIESQKHSLRDQSILC